jgi:hypothetical protein
MGAGSRGVKLRMGSMLGYLLLPANTRAMAATKIAPNTTTTTAMLIIRDRYSEAGGYPGVNGGTHLFS